ncbi:MAG: MFS transporter [Coprobacillaceae bacterium]
MTVLEGTVSSNDTSKNELLSKNFLLMVVGQIISIFGSAILRFALSLYVLDITGRADMFAILFAISNIPVILTPIGGVIADRFNRRNLMVIYDFCSSAIIFGLFILLMITNVSIVMIAVVMVLLSTISAMYTPTVSASLPLLVKNNIEKANGIVTAVQSLSGVVAPILGGILYNVLGMEYLVAISCIAFFASAILEIFITIPYTKRNSDGSALAMMSADLKNGFLYVKQNSFILKSTILAAILNLVLSPLLIVGAPIILRVAMQSNDVMYGVGMGVINLAMILGAITIGFFTKFLNVKKIFYWILMLALLLIPIIISVLPIMNTIGYYPSFSIFMMGVVPISMIVTILSIYLISRVQKRTPNENLGKVMAIIMGVAQCSAPIGQIAYGSLFETF